MLVLFSNMLNSIIQDNLGLSVAGAVIVALALLVWNIFLHLNVSRIKNNQQQLFSGKNGVDLEKTILDHAKNLKELDKDIQDLFGISNKINDLAKKSIHKIGVVRFNPFKDLGGDQSFSVALLDGENSGVVISALHTREGNRVYSKPVEKGKAVKYPLTNEEQEAIKRADAGDNAGKKA
ncbi:MAG TPA: hypothetical protein DEB07_04425 [Candidatus Moranbacteria bacterium]|nr:MAG: hypothetical protein UW19_C0014G0042 [Candidatus Moranbacteria bacterium GW2011_GWF2_44_10]KKT69798.1 MAG: hypothetical protein UW66_C0061G0002 [Candidatus Moranbacteria bacterium GW2011_GWF1_44_4]HBB36765.1 hypothetical protein [Candidatus Moranbacteria bacterium]HBU25449.1 hypothetical protein [Candidatus Moranbacteria bacterium]